MPALQTSLHVAAEHTFGVGDLFSEAAGRRLDASAPLAQRLRPATLDDFVGQEHVVGPGRALRLAIEQDRVPSMILYGPPGSGKTTLARIVAQTTGAEFEELSAVSGDGRERPRGAGPGARAARRERQRTILFLDEIHRFNKAQQDALLPGVEEGLADADRRDDREPVLRGQLGAALARADLRARAALDVETLRGVVRRGAAALDATLAPEVEELIAQRAGGDARNALNILELSVETARAEGVELEERHVDDAARKRPLAYDKGGDRHYDFISAWIKSTRASDVQASVYYLAAMIEGGEDARFIARRMIVLASEDIGNADPQALLIAVAAAQAVEHVGLPEARLNLAQAAVYLARAPKSNACTSRSGSATEDVRERGHLLPPAALRSAAYPGAKEARARRGLRLSARRPARLRGRLPARGAEGQRLLRRGRARGSACRARSRRARRRACAVSFSRSRIGFTSTTSSESSSAGLGDQLEREMRLAVGQPAAAPACRRRARTSGRRRRGRG